VRRQSTVERAFELARDGQCRSVDDVRRKLAKEGYESVDAHLMSAAIKTQLKAAIAAANVPA
jgi:tRNA G26 N,N-dimethylase Trm1